MPIFDAFSAFSPELILTIQLICLAAYFLKGMAGFGPAIVFIPTMSLLFGPRTALAGSAVVDLFVGLAMIVAIPYEKGDWPLVFKMVAIMSVGTVVGASLAGFIAEEVIFVAMFLFVATIAVSFLVVDRPLPPRLTNAAFLRLPVACALGGLTGGFVGLSGPFIVAAARPIMDKARFRRIMAAVFLLEGVLKLAVYGGVGMIATEVVHLAIVAAPAVAVGLFIGFRTHVRVSERAFNVTIGAVLLVIALRIGWGLVTG